MIAKTNPSDYEVTVSFEHPLNKSYPKFEVSYQRLLEIIALLQQENLPEELDEDEIEEMRKVAVCLAKFGSANASPEELEELNQDILELFSDEEYD